MTDSGGPPLVAWRVVGKLIALSFQSPARPRKGRNVISERQHYRLPLKLIDSYIWASLNQPAKAILPVLGVHANKGHKALPGVELIAKLSGYKDLRKIREGIIDLIQKGLITKVKEGRHNAYFLTNLALKEDRQSFFPIYKAEMILSKRWADLTPSEKALYPVLGNKGKINDPDTRYTDIHALGNLDEVKQYYQWSGISKRSFYYALNSLIRHGLIEIWEDGDMKQYAVYVPHAQGDKNKTKNDRQVRSDGTGSLTILDGREEDEEEYTGKGSMTWLR